MHGHICITENNQRGGLKKQVPLKKHKITQALEIRTFLTAFEKLWPHHCFHAVIIHNINPDLKMIPHRKCQSGLTPKGSFRHLFSFKSYANKVISGYYE